MQTYFIWKITTVSTISADNRHRILVHILDKGNVLSWDFVLLQSPPHDISWYFIICLLEVNKDHVQVLLLLPMSLHELSYYKNRLHGRPSRHEPKLVLGHTCHSPKAMLDNPLPKLHRMASSYGSISLRVEVNILFCKLFDIRLYSAY